MKKQFKNILEINLIIGKNRMMERGKRIVQVKQKNKI